MGQPSRPVHIPPADHRRCRIPHSVRINRMCTRRHPQHSLLSFVQTLRQKPQIKSNRCWPTFVSLLANLLSFLDSSLFFQSSSNKPNTMYSSHGQANSTDSRTNVDCNAKTRPRMPAKPSCSGWDGWGCNAERQPSDSRNLTVLAHASSCQELSMCPPT